MSPLRRILCAALAAGAVGGAIAADAAPRFTLTSPDLAGNKFPLRHVLGGFGCTGENVSPELKWQHAPAGTKSFALHVHDPDAPTGSGFWHWTVYNIPGDATGLARGAGNAGGTLPGKAYGGFNDFADTGAAGGNGHYGGPCPPAGDKPHRYIFTLYALAVDDLTNAGQIPRSGSAALHGFVLNRGLGDKLLGKAVYTAKYGR